MLGHFPINLRLHPSVDVARLSTFLQSLVSPSLTLSMSISSLNDRNMLFAPEAHEESLHAGRLQLPTSALVVVDETAMDEGKLESHGLKNLNALAKALGQAKLDYIFPFSQFSFDVDLNFIVLSTSKSLLPVRLNLLSLSVMPSAGERERLTVKTGPTRGAHQITKGRGGR